MPGQGFEKVESDCHSWSPQYCLDAKKTAVLVVGANNTQDREAREEATEYSMMKKKKKQWTQMYRKPYLAPGTVSSQQKTSKTK